MLDLAGQRYGRLTVLEEGEHRKTKGGHSIRLWICRCDCGNTVTVSTNALRRGNTSSCGCFRRELLIKSNTTHNLSRTKLYRIWNSMRGRCNNPSDKGFKNYGGRGISVCESWNHSFSAFYDWAISNGYSDGLTIERIHNNGNYEPQNCEWIPLSDQSKNRRSCHYIAYKGQIKTLSDWARYLGVNRSIIRYYIEKFGDDVKGLSYVENMFVLGGR